MENIKSKKVSKTDPESGWFHKAEHKSVFAYSIQIACDKNGFVTNFWNGNSKLYKKRGTN